MTIEIESVDMTAIETALLQPQNLIANADIGGVSFPRSLLVSDTDWHFLASAIEEPPAANPVVRTLLTGRSVLER